MLERSRSGLVELIPTPQEKRQAILQDYVLDLLENLHQRVQRLEVQQLGGVVAFNDGLAMVFEQTMKKIRAEEADAHRAYEASSS